MTEQFSWYSPLVVLLAIIFRAFGSFKPTVYWDFFNRRVPTFISSVNNLLPSNWYYLHLRHLISRWAKIFLLVVYEDVINCFTYFVRSHFVLWLWWWWWWWWSLSINGNDIILISLSLLESNHSSTKKTSRIVALRSPDSSLYSSVFWINVLFQILSKQYLDEWSEFKVDASPRDL